MRSKFGPEDMIVFAGALTNGSNTVEQFHFYDELDSNAAKTASGRLSIKALSIELGASGSWGRKTAPRLAGARCGSWGPTSWFTPASSSSRPSG